MKLRRPKLNSLIFWLTVPAAFSALVLLGLRLLTATSKAPSSAADAPSRLHWLLTAEGERRGFAIESDLSRDAAAWQLWGPGRGMAALNPISTLRPGSFFTDAGFGINGGYWDEQRQPVGVCAGERGIHGARSHPGGFALTADRAWIGPLTVKIRLTQSLPAPETNSGVPTSSENTSKKQTRATGKKNPQGKKNPAPSPKPETEKTTQTRAAAPSLDLALNPRPLPRRAPSLIDRSALPGELKLEGPATVAWLERAPGPSEPLRFNTVTRLRVERAFRQPKDAPLPEPPEHVLELVLPDLANSAAASPGGPASAGMDPSAPRIPQSAIVAGTRFSLVLQLEPVRGVVRLATCAGPRLLKDGMIAEGLGPEGAETRAERTWRTAVGCDSSGRRLILVMLARGRDGLPGVTLRETARTLAELGASDALNLDGGSSSCVWYPRLRSELRPLFPLQSEIHHAIFLRKDPAISPGQK